MDGPILDGRTSEYTHRKINERRVIERFIGLGLFQTIVTVTSTVFNNTKSSIYLVTALRASSHYRHTQLLWRDVE